MWLCSAHMNQYLPSFHFDIDSLEYCTCRYYQLWILIVYLTSRLSIFLYNIDTSLFNRSIDRFPYRSLPLAGLVWMTSEMIEHWLSLPIAISRPSKDDCKRKITKGFGFPASRRLEVFSRVNVTWIQPMIVSSFISCGSIANVKYLSKDIWITKRKINKTFHSIESCTFDTDNSLFSIEREEEDSSRHEKSMGHYQLLDQPLFINFYVLLKQH